MVLGAGGGGKKIRYRKRKNASLHKRWPEETLAGGKKKTYLPWEAGQGRSREQRRYVKRGMGRKAKENQKPSAYVLPEDAPLSSQNFLRGKRDDSKRGEANDSRRDYWCQEAVISRIVLEGALVFECWAKV